MALVSAIQYNKKERSHGLLAADYRVNPKMQFPFYIGLSSWKIHPHPLFESLGYAVAFCLLLRNRRSDTIPFSQRSSVIVGGMIGAFLGAKGLVFLQHIDVVWQNWQQGLLLILQGKTVVGALLGGLVGVEVTSSYTKSEIME